MKNKITHPVLIIWFAIVMLLLLSSVKLPIIPYLNSYRNIDLLKDIKPSDKKPVIAARAKMPAADIKTIAPGSNVIDSSLIADYADDTLIMMKAFYKKLNSLKTAKGKVRIAYFGDSFIEGDYITGELRNKLQQIYGGNGIGFVPVQSIVADDYVSIKFNNNTSWTDYNFHDNPQKYSLGLMGHVFYSKGDSWCQYSSLNKKFECINLYTGKTPDSSATIALEKDGQKKDIVVNNDGIINQTILNCGTPVNRFKLSCANTSLPLYGISIEDSAGVYVDNYGFRGNTGLLSLQIPDDVMKEFNTYFKYDLIIIHYGLNVIEHGQTNYEWFNRTMCKLINKVKSDYPGVPILLISASDVAYNEKGTYITDPGVPLLVKQQNEIAQKNKVAFWNLYYSMGGENTIANWVEGDTVYAYKDYMHVNERGADKVAGIFLNKLLQPRKN